MTFERSNTSDAVAYYLQHGWHCVPIPARKKGPELPGWQRLRIESDQVLEYFAPGMNVGVLLGEPSGWLVDVDLDCPEAIELAAGFLPETPLITGRANKPRSHWWYICRGAVTRQFRVNRRESIVEIRSTGGQTVVGPSIHPDGDEYEALSGEQMPAEVDFGWLELRVRKLAEAVLARRGVAVPASWAKVEPPPPPPAPTPQERTTGDGELSVENRAILYLDQMDAAISGQGGHSATYAAATAMVHGFGLDRDTAFRLLRDHYNPRCQPPWTERELTHKVIDAASKPHDKPFGYLRDAERDWANPHPEVDLSEFRFGSMAAQEPAVLPLVNHPSNSDFPDPGPFPPELLEVPGLIGEVMAFNLATAVRPQPLLALMAALALQSVLCARKVRDERGNRTNLYFLGLARSGSGKEHARKVNKEILRLAGASALEGPEEIASDAGMFAAVDANPGILFQLDEFGRLLKTLGDANRSPHLYAIVGLLLKLYSSADTTLRGKAYADNERNKIIQQPCVSLYGTTVPESFWSSLTSEALSDGFIGRLVVLETNERPARVRVPAQDLPDSIVNTARAWFETRPGGNLGSVFPQPTIIPTTDDAYEVFDDLARLADAKMDHSPDGIAAVWSRCEEKACRLALTYACSANSFNPVIDRAAAEFGCRLASWTTEHLLSKSALRVSESKFDAAQKKILRLIVENGGKMSRWELARAARSLSARERREIIENLLDTGSLVATTTPTTGRPEVTYAIA